MNRPEAQLVQPPELTAPVAVAYLPASHATHALAPLLAWKVPATHVAQLVDPAAE